MTAPKNYTPTPAPYQAQHQLPPPPSPLPPPADPLEQRVLDLLYPYRDECFTEDEGKDESASLAKERMAHVLSGNLAFLIRHNQASYGKQIDPNDIFIASRYFKGGKQAVKTESGPVAGLGVFVNGNGFTHTVIRIVINPGDDTLELLSTQLDQLMAQFFPGT